MSGRVCLYISKLLFNLSLLMGHTTFIYVTSTVGDDIFSFL